MSRVTNLEYLQFNPSACDENVLGPGGIVAIFTADAAQTLLTGDVVYCSDANEVAKSTTAATVGGTFAGVVVGGALTGMDIPLNLAGDGVVIGLTAATAGMAVLVQIAGIATVIPDATISAPNRLIGDASVAGRVDVDPGGTTPAWILGVLLTDATQAVAAKMLINNYFIYRTA